VNDELREMNETKYTYLGSAVLGAFAKLRKATIALVVSFGLSVRSFAWNNSAPIKWIFMKFYI